jgi:hypothetical protein
MDDLMNNGTIPLIVFGVIIVVMIWVVGAHLRTRAQVTREAEYRTLADRAVKAQEAAEHRLASVTDQLTGFTDRFGEVNRRLSTIEGVLKDAE